MQKLDIISYDFRHIYFERDIYFLFVGRFNFIIMLHIINLFIFKMIN